MDLLELGRVNTMLATAEPEAIIDWAVEQFGPYIIMGTSFGRNALELLHTVHSRHPWVPAVFVDPGDIPASNFEYAEAIMGRMPHLVVRMYKNDTPLSNADRLSLKRGGQARLEVYKRRKLPLMRRAMNEHWAQAILYGRRFDQLRPEERSRFRHANPDEAGVMRVYPSLYTSDEKVLARIVCTDLMHPDGYPEGIRDDCGAHL